MNKISKIRHLKVGNKVVVIRGEERGKQARILEIDRKNNRAILEGVNLATKHLKRTTKGVQAGRVQKPLSIQISNLKLVCPNCSKPTVVKSRLVGEDRELVCSHCNESVTQKENV